MRTIDKWANRELAAQIVFPRLNIFDYLMNNEYKSKITQLVAEGIGGFCLFGGNIEENIKVINELQIFAEIPLLFCGDFENGIPMRLSEGTEFPHSMALGSANNLEYTRKQASLIAQEAKAIGAYWNLAPVADINNNPNNPVINIRAFGETSDLVLTHSLAYIEGTQSEKVLACAKHFPGHGNTEVNSHLELPVLKLSKEEIYSNELIPFVKSIESGVKSIMAGHLMIPALDDTYPATLSKKITTDLLRNELNFKGIIITDALEMKAITNKYTIGQIAELTINAGVNVLLMPENDDDLLNALEKLIENDSEFKNKVRNSIELIISAKRWAGIMPQFHRDDMNANLFTEHPYKALKYAYKGLKFIGNDELLPLKDINSIAVFSLLQKSEYMDNASRFMKMLGDATEFDIDFAFLDANIKQENIDEYINLTMDTELIIFPVFFRNQTYANSIAFPDTMKEAVRQISADKKTIIIFFGSPYFEKEFDPDLKIMTYSDSYASLAATIVKLSGRSIDWIED